MLELIQIGISFSVSFLSTALHTADSSVAAADSFLPVFNPKRDESSAQCEQPEQEAFSQPVCMNVSLGSITVGGDQLI